MARRGVALAAAGILLAAVAQGAQHQAHAVPGGVTMQARRAAANAGIPLVVVGRQMTKDSLAAALTPLLQQKQAAGRAKAQE